MKNKSNDVVFSVNVIKNKKIYKSLMLLTAYNDDCQIDIWF